MKRFLLAAGLLFLCANPLLAQRLSRSIKKNTQTDIVTSVENHYQRNFSTLLLLGTGNYFSRNTWQHICMQLQERLKAYHIHVTYEYLSRDSIEAKRQYATLMKDNNFDAVLWFACDGRARMNELATRTEYWGPYGGSAYGNYYPPTTTTSRHNATQGDSVVELSGQRGDDLIVDQRWLVTLYTCNPNAVVWAANMNTRVVEMNEKSYKRVTDAMIKQLQENMVLPAADNAKK